MVAFTRGDARLGRWIGATSPALPDASPHAPGDGNTDYVAEYAGGWRWVGQDGTRAVQAADGSSFLLGAAMPSPTRHIVDANGQRIASAYTPAQRNPSPPAAMPFSMRLASGASVTVSATGAVMLEAPAGQPLVLATSGGTLTIEGNGSMTLLTSAGGTVVVSSGGAATPVRLSGGGNSVVLMAE
jgi:hypothetical protein